MVPFGLCADDYGLVPGIGAAVRRLLALGRLSAVSCLVTTEAWPAEAAALAPVAAAGSVEVGLHVNLTLGRPLGPLPRLAPGGTLPALPALIGRAVAGRVDVAEAAAELDRQIERFTAAFGRPPDFIDGHEHVHGLPSVRRALLTVAARRFPAPGRRPWLRFPAMGAADLGCHPWPAWPRALAITLLTRGLRADAVAAGFTGNQGFRGVRRFRGEAPYPVLFARFVAGIRPGGLVMCHPGLAAAERGGGAMDGSDRGGSHPAAARAEEYRFLASAAFPALLARRGLRLARLADPAPAPAGG
jgi:predicted glycoside hydrolase/deacetylase ChbG (UPF0249 family)